MKMRFAGRFESGNPMFDIDLRALELAPGPQGLVLYAGNGAGGGISAYALSDEGLALLESQGHPVASLQSGPLTLAPDGTRVYLAGQGDQALHSYTLAADGSFGRAQQDSLPGLAPGGVDQLTSVTLTGGQGALYTLSGSGQIQGWRLAGDGTVGAQLNTGGAQVARPGSALLEVVDTTAQPVLLVADAGRGGLVSYRIDGRDGDLTALAQLGAAEGVAIAAPTALETFTAYGQSWALLAAAGSDSLTLISVAPSGQLQFADHLMDTQATRFGAVQALAVTEVEGHVLVVAGGGDDGLSLFRLLPEGRLIHLSSLADAAGLGLQNVSALAMAAQGDQLQILASSGLQGGLSRFTLSLTDLGQVLQGRAGDTLRGGGDDDLLCGAAGGASTLRGGAGDDMLVQGAAGDRLRGDGGADVFVAKPLEGRLHILDFTPGQDRLDLSLFVDLRSAGQLNLQQTGQGALLRHGESEILITRAGGGSLSATELFGAGFDYPDRLDLGDVTPWTGGDTGGETGGDTGGDTGGGDTGGGDTGGGDTGGGTGGSTGGGSGGNTGEGDTDGGTGGNTGDDTPEPPRGSNQADVLRGSDAGDLLRGFDGDDRLLGYGGNDTLEGGAGSDLLLGGGQADRLFGNGGQDTLKGGGGQDLLKGGAGSDRLLGGGQADRLFGNGGQDILKGGGGQDLLTGGAGSDHLLGNGGQDILKGGGGRDALKGGGSSDRLLGGGGADQLKGQGGRDTLEGGKGADLLWGGGGRDVFLFRKGHGSDEIRDFRPGPDHIDLSGLGRGGAQRFADLELSQQGRDVLVRTGEGEILLKGLQAGELGADDFLF